MSFLFRPTGRPAGRAAGRATGLQQPAAAAVNIKQSQRASISCTAPSESQHKYQSGREKRHFEPLMLQFTPLSPNNRIKTALCGFDAL